MKKRILSIFLSVCMIVSCMAGITFTVSATVLVATFSDLRNAVNSAADGVAKEIRLDYNINIDDDDPIKINSNKIIVIDLNGYCLNGNNSAGTLIHIYENGTLTVKDNVGNGRITGSCDLGVFTGGTFNMSGGTISGNVNNDVFVANGGTFNMSGGSITGGNSSSSVFVVNGGTFNMSGGTISGSRCYDGSVYNIGTFNMNSGTISGNTLGVNNYRTFNMSGGNITGNNGTGLYDGGVFCVSSTSILNMTGGTISDNSPYNVYIYSHGVLKMTGGTINGRFTDENNNYVTVTFVANGGSGNMSEQYIKKSTATALKTVTFTAPSCATFAGWNTQANGSGSSYANGASINITADTTLYARWNYNHTLTAHSAVPATCTTAGNSEYWQCSGCGNYFSDSAGTTQIAANSWVIPAKGHNFSYTANGASITAHCANANCPVTSGLTLTINQPDSDDLTYDGTEKAATLGSGYNTTAFPDTYTIKYYKGTQELTGAPVNAGTYTAKVTAGSGTGAVTASCEYTISKRYIIIVAKEQTVYGDDDIQRGVDMVSVTTIGVSGAALVAGDALTDITLTVYSSDIKASGAVITRGSGDNAVDVTDCYEVSYFDGRLTRIPVTLVPAKAATCTEDGNVEYYKDTNDKLYTKSGDSYTEKTLGDVTIAKLGHNFVDGVCTRCGEADPDYHEPEPYPWSLKPEYVPSSTTAPAETTKPDETKAPADVDEPGEITQPEDTTTPAPEKEPVKITDPDDWDDVINAIDDIPEGGKLPVDMSGSPVLPADVISAIAGRDIDLVLDIGGGLSWTINGKDVTGATGDIDLGVTLGDSGIPADVINNITGERYSVTLHINHNGPFGFTATLSVTLRPSDAGLFANLFRYDPAENALRFVSCAKISADGTAELPFDHASYYTIVIDDHPMNGDTDTVVDGAKEENPHTGAALGGLALFLLAGAAAVISRKRK